jgi:hypothetical protein
VVSQLIEEDALPFNSLEACFSQSFKVGDDGVLVFDFDIYFLANKTAHKKTDY